jgi:hypothetical protein
MDGQLNLFPYGTDLSSTGGFRDPAFADNKTRPIHRWVPWIAGFSAAFVDDVLATYAPPARTGSPAVVLDPFAGVGTTLVQAQLHCHQTIGFEINPYAALAARVKLRAPFLHLPELHKWIEALKATSQRWSAKPGQARARVPEGFRSRIPFFSDRVMQQVSCILDFIQTIESADFYDLFRVAFGSVMVSFSNYTYEPSLSTRLAAGKPILEGQNAVAVLLDKLYQMAADIEWVQTQGPKPQHLAQVHRIVNDNFLAAAEKNIDVSADIVITSPPYLNNYHYVRNTRPQLYWLALADSSEMLKKLEEENFGKFWQIVRTVPPLEMRFSLKELRQLIERLRGIRTDKGPYGGPGWANYVTAYFNDAQMFFHILRKVLKPGGVGVIVVGNSIIQGLEFRVDDFFADLAREEGFIVEGIRLIRQKRVGASITRSSVRRGERNRATLYESAVIVRNHEAI